MSKGWWQRLSEERREEIRRRKSEQYWAAREEHGYFTSKGKPETLCWSCQLAVKECPWSANFEPVDGWDAEETKIMAPHGTIPSFLVKKCPLFVPDPPISKKEKRSNE